MSETPSALNTALAEELLPCTRMPLCESLLYEGHARADCPAAYRPAVALALQSKDDSAALEIDRLTEALEEIVSLHLGDCPAAMDEVDFARAHCNRIRRIARAALQTDGGTDGAA